MRDFLFKTHSILSALVIVSILLLCIPYGFQYLMGPTEKEWMFPLSALALLVSIGFLCWMALKNQHCQVDRERVWYLNGVLVIGMLWLSVYFQSKVLSLDHVIIFGFFTLACCVGILINQGKALIFPLAVIALLVVQSSIGLSTENDFRAANMLPVIQLACQEFRQNINPYLVEHLTVTSIHLYYFPALISPYCLPEWAGLDVRIVNVICLSLLVACLLMRSLDASRSPYAASALALLFASPMVSQMMAHGHIWVYFLACILFAELVLRRSFLSAAAVAGFLMASYQLSMFLLFPALVWLWKNTSAKEAGLLITTAALVYLILILPALVSVPDFVGHFYLRLGGDVAENHITQGDIFDQVSIGASIYSLVGKTGMMVLQVVFLLISGLIASRKEVSVEYRALLLCGMSYILIISLNPFINRYFYIPGLILIFMALSPRDVLPSRS
jgi:hypothetical protein